MEQEESAFPNDIFDLLFYLDMYRIRYFLQRCSNTSITVFIAEPEKRIEIECQSGGRFEIAVFTGEEVSELSLQEVLEGLVNEAG